MALEVDVKMEAEVVLVEHPLVLEFWVMMMAVVAVGIGVCEAVTVEEVVCRMAYAMAAAQKYQLRCLSWSQMASSV